MQKAHDSARMVARVVYNLSSPARVILEVPATQKESYDDHER